MDALNAMFGFIFTQPIYKTLQQMRVVHITALLVTYQWTEELLLKIPPLSSNPDAITLGVYFANFATLVSIFWKSINDMRKPHD